jgi:hypothetical protein
MINPIMFIEECNRKIVMKNKLELLCKETNGAIYFEKLSKTRKILFYGRKYPGQDSKQRPTNRRRK